MTPVRQVGKYWYVLRLEFWIYISSRVVAKWTTWMSQWTRLNIGTFCFLHELRPHCNSETLKNVNHTNDSDSNTMNFTSSPESYKLKSSVSLAHLGISLAGGRPARKGTGHPRGSISSGILWICCMVWLHRLWALDKVKNFMRTRDILVSTHRACRWQQVWLYVVRLLRVINIAFDANDHPGAMCQWSSGDEFRWWH